MKTYDNKKEALYRALCESLFVCKGPRGEREGKNERCDAAAELSEVNPLQTPFAERVSDPPPKSPASGRGLGASAKARCKGPRGEREGKTSGAMR